MTSGYRQRSGSRKRVGGLRWSVAAQYMQPLSSSPDPETGLAEVLHPGASYEVLPDPLDTRLPGLRRPVAQLVQGAGAQAHAEPVPQDLGEPLLGRTGRPLSRSPWPPGAARTAPVPSRPPERRPGLRARIAGSDRQTLDARSLPAWVPGDHRPATASADRPHPPALGPCRTGSRLAPVLLNPVRLDPLAQPRAPVPGLTPAAPSGAPSLAAGTVAGRRFRRPIARRRFPAVEAQAPLRLARYGLDVRKVLPAMASPPQSQVPLRLLTVVRDPKYLGSYDLPSLPPESATTAPEPSSNGNTFLTVDTRYLLGLQLLWSRSQMMFQVAGWSCVSRSRRCWAS